MSPISGSGIRKNQGRNNQDQKFPYGLKMSLSHFRLSPSAKAVLSDIVSLTHDLINIFYDKPCRTTGRRRDRKRISAIAPLQLCSQNISPCFSAEEGQQATVPGGHLGSGADHVIIAPERQAKRDRSLWIPGYDVCWLDWVVYSWHIVNYTTKLSYGRSSTQNT